MLSASTARLAENSAMLGDPEIVQMKGADEPVAAQRRSGMEERHRAARRAESNVRPRHLLDRAVDGHGAVVGVEVFTTYCESHASRAPFDAVALAARPQASRVLTGRPPAPDTGSGF